ncbi:hypothetical protein HGRIS_001996 [Hohenbuehelia grisea]|uniref:CHAT domain-containing protein n=1 Tax=Hohenbuehelia grisea TaxID=104357 RepID=A0ABR3JJ99_9AGAR
MDLRTPDNENKPDKQALRRTRKKGASKWRKLTLIMASGRALVRKYSNRCCVSLFRQIRGGFRTNILQNLASALLDQYHRSAEQGDLDKAIQLLTEALGLCPPGHLERGMSLNNLAQSLLDRYRRSGEQGDLEEAIQLLTEALGLCPPGHLERGMSLNNLAQSLLDRYRRSGEQGDLEEAIQLLTEALGLCPPGHLHRDISLNNLAQSLLDRYRRSGEQGDLDEAIQLLTEALGLRPPGHLERGMSLNNLTVALRDRYRRSGEPGDLEEAIQLLTEALGLCPPGHLERGAFLTNLAGALRDRYRGSVEQGDLDEAIKLFAEALGLCSPGHLHFATASLNLAETLWLAGAPHLDCNMNTPLTLIERGAKDQLSLPLDTLRCAQIWVQMAPDNTQQHEAYSTFIDILRRYIAIGPTVEQQYTSLAHQASFLSLPLNVAARATAAQNVERAVEWLDAGRSLLLADSRRVNQPFPPPERPPDDLTEKFIDICTKLQNVASVASQQYQSGLCGISRGHLNSNAAVSDLLIQKRKLMSEFDRLVGLIRNSPGHEDFLKPLSFEKLRKATSDGPVIIVNCTEHRSDVIIVFAEQPPSVIALDQSFWQTALLVHRRYLAAREEAKKEKASELFGATLAEVSRALWDLVVADVVTELKKRGVVEQSRIWWCPTSFLTALPFHAAGRGKRSKKPKNGERPKGFLIDYYIPSYTPTLKALIDARQPSTASTAVQAQPPKVLIVAQTKDPQLEHAQSELSVLDDQLATFDRVVLDDEAATIKSVMDTLPSFNWAHFICHGEVPTLSPFDSCLRLYREKLTLGHIVNARLPDAQFIFLSACHTAELNDPKLTDEILHLAGAMQFSGFRSVVGTLWEMNDKDGPFVAQQFYGEMLEGDDGVNGRHTKAARALWKVVSEMKKHKLGMERWMNYVHIGA